MDDGARFKSKPGVLVGPSKRHSHYTSPPWMRGLKWPHPSLGRLGAAKRLPLLIKKLRINTVITARGALCISMHERSTFITSFVPWQLVATSMRLM
eukprot:scaffold112084_cov63-Attheya_sp.AAC.1